MLVIQKYGGSSVADVARLRRVAERIVNTVRDGHRVVVVVSAMGRTTDELVALAHAVSPNPPRRELDMLLTTGERISMALLSMAIHQLGAAAISLTGSQSGIITDENHTEAQIVTVRPQRILEGLQAGRVVIVAGYQGVSREREITTLGRGGSDTTAVALAAALDAELTEICSDVDGIYTADPRVVPAARRLADIRWDDLITLSKGGARVIAATAAEYARDHGVEFFARATQGNGPGTHVGPNAPPAVGVAAQPDGTVTVLGVQASLAMRTVPGATLVETLEPRGVVLRVAASEVEETQRALHALL